MLVFIVTIDYRWSGNLNSAVSDIFLQMKLQVLGMFSIFYPILEQLGSSWDFTDKFRPPPPRRFNLSVQ